MHFLERSKKVAEGTVGRAIQFEDGEAEKLLGQAAIGDASAPASGGADADDVVVIDVWGWRRMRRRPRQLPPPRAPRHRCTGECISPLWRRERRRKEEEEEPIGA